MSLDDIKNQKHKPAKIVVSEFPDEYHNIIEFRTKFDTPFPFPVVEYDPDTGDGKKLVEKDGVVEIQKFFHVDGFTVIDGIKDPDLEEVEAIKEILPIRKRFNQHDRVDAVNKISCMLRNKKALAKGIITAMPVESETELGGIPDPTKGREKSKDVNISRTLTDMVETTMIVNKELAQQIKAIRGSIDDGGSFE